MQAMGGVSAFSRQRERLRQVDAAEVAAMEELLANPRFEDAEGFLEDDFVLAATQVEPRPLSVFGIDCRRCLPPTD